MPADIDRQCLICGKDFTIPRSANWPGKYCSRICRDAALRTVKESNCLTCGAVVRRKKYCNRACYVESMKGKSKPNKKRATCEVCGLEAGKGARKYCSRVCYLKVHTDNSVTPELDRIRRSAAYKQWRVSVFDRDDYTCQLCGVRGGELNADHIRSFAHYPELRFDVDNGRTLCVSCHRSTPTYGGGSRRKACVAVDTAGY